jgi:hypothetical protein
VSGLPDGLRAEARKWAEETALAQGLPVKVEHVETLRDVATLLGLKPQARQTGASREESKRL